MTASRLRYLDGLRGILAFIVFLHHFLYAFYPNLIFGGDSGQYLSSSGFSLLKIFALTPLNLFFNPGTAIHFFFLLSGYVQSCHYFASGDTHAVQKNFVKRYFRLMIPTLAVLVIVFIFVEAGMIRKDLMMTQNPMSGTWIAAMFPGDLSFPALLKHAAIDTFLGFSRYYQVLWTMPYELYNSWMVLMILLVTHRISNRTWIILVWLGFQLLFLKAFYGAAFTIGLLLAKHETSPSAFLTAFSRPALKALCLITGIYFATYPYTGYRNATSGTFYHLISFFDTYPHIISYLFGDTLLFIYLLNSRRAQKFLDNRLLHALGDISFMLYLIHMVVLFSFSAWLQHQTAHLQYAVAINLSVTTIIVILSSWILTKAFDTPALRFMNRLIGRAFQPTG